MSAAYSSSAAHLWLLQNTVFIGTTTTGSSLLQALLAVFKTHPYKISIQNL